MVKTQDSRRKTQDSEGFTLIELMLVVIILGVLAAMVMPRLVGRSEQARIAAAQADINASIALALDLYEMDNGEYPANSEFSKLWQKSDSGKGPYLKKAPMDPWGHNYEYEQLDGGKDYNLCSEGPDDSKSDDDICNKGKEK